jgi:hypothetical protein
MWRPVRVAPPASSLLTLGALGALGMALLLGSTGCAFANVDVHPPETPDLGAHGPARPPDVAQTPGRGREVIVLSPFVDSRLETTRCGMQKNGYDSETADVKCTLPPGRWLADELAIELTRAGYKPLRVDAVPGPNTVVVHGEVWKLFLEPVHHFWTLTVEGDFAANLVVTSPSGLRAERGFFVKGEEKSMASSQGVFQAASDSASHSLARQMVQSLTELLDRYPDLGTPSASAPGRTAQVSP